MDSMRTLNTSLPHTLSSQAQAQQPPEQLLQAFKSAALSVTNLYKSAASEQASARAAGFQDALDELLAFLDKENLGLDDGEGWKVRQWATERLDSGVLGQNENETDEEMEEQKRTRSSSPPISRRCSGDEVRTNQTNRIESPIRTGSAPPSVAAVRQISPGRQNRHTPPRTEAFTFRSSEPYPQGHDVDMDVSNNNNASPAPAVRLEVIPRNMRHSPRHRHASRTSHRTPASLATLGSGAGQKRKANSTDVFDFGSFFSDKDTPGGGAAKKGRHT
ncbi:MAG: hypothetical protein M1820_010251 [Bogoriella megaspora]|nr:MAG: hypothetical protein M1820_010251 [Bogoriella megaspora]